MEEKRIQQGYDVLDTDGSKLGTVGDVYDTYFRIDTGFLGLGKDYYIPFDSITRVSRNQVVLNFGKNRLDRMGFDRRPTGVVEKGVPPAVGMAPAGRPETKEEIGPSGERVMRLREEELEARRHSEKVGEVDITKEVIEERRRMNVPYTEERVHIERRPVRPGEAVGPMAEGENEIRVPIYEEEVEVTKHPVVREEIVISKERVTREKAVEETIRREVPRIHKEGDVDIDTEEDLTDEARARLDEEQRKRGLTQ